MTHSPFLRKEYLAAVFLDMTSAFYNVSYPVLADVMATLEILAEFILIIIALVSD